MTTNDEKSTMDDSTLKSATPSFDEKPKPEAEESVRQGSSSPSPAPSVKNEHHEQPELKKVMSAKEAQAELTKIMTSGEGVEYPTGVKLGLVTMALCLSVFLMALDNTIIATAIPKITDQFHSLPDVGVSLYLKFTSHWQISNVL
jgi:hypothetical protein